MPPSQSGWITWRGAFKLFILLCRILLVDASLALLHTSSARTFGDSADMHAKQLKAAHDKIEKIHARVASCEDTGSVVADLHKSHHQVSQEHRDKLSTLHSSVSERLSYLEGLMGESADMHARELEALKTSHSRMASEAKARDAHHTTVSERLDFIEKLLGDSADKHAQEIKAAHSKIDQVHQRVAGAQHEDLYGTTKRWIGYLMMSFLD